MRGIGCFAFGMLCLFTLLLLASGVVVCIVRFQ